MKSTRDYIADELRSLRAKLKYSIEIVAEKSGVSKDTICRYENNQVSMQIDILEKLLNVYNENFDYFFTQIYANKQSLSSQNQEET